MPSKYAAGQCLCGNIQFRAQLPIKWCVHCHCSMCRMAHGAAFVTWVSVPRAQFNLISGETHLNWYASSAEASRGFCGHCGTTLFFRYDDFDPEIYVTLANFLEPIDRPPSAHVFYDTHVGWVQLSDNLEQHDDLPPDP